MSLDLIKVAPQIEGMARKLSLGSEERRRHTAAAISILHREKDNFDALRRKTLGSRTPFLPVAGPVGTLDAAIAPKPLPPDFTVIATDGSHIDVDRHRQARCFLLNISAVSLTYGAHPAATLDSFPRLYFGDDETALNPPAGVSGRAQVLEGALLGIKRSADECDMLAMLAEGLPEKSTALALMDGALILWGLGSKDYPEFVIETFLQQGQLKHLSRMKRLNETRKLAVASYISFPRSNDVMNTVRIAACPHEFADCGRYCDTIAPGKRECDTVSGVSDRELFYNLLKAGERSALYESTATLVKEHYGEHGVCFFYLRVDGEIARIEMPKWVTENEELLELTHTLVLDQTERGQGYPAALSEAHEQAVITGADRENFWQLTESFLEEENLPTTGSAKNFSKKTRWI
jgi:GNAT superfamily N-acetyltransferase